ncbi:alpha/beta fold hydrolase [Brevundimonas sp. Root1279]|uniref:alpha/beta fold hydrolase n=1 Tax=Brevundimonas sp. Root1279 TaxID=1736443 RepID=UPI0006F451C5|nr:alpha/beta hydrolase [Brevundimonas sp. Root1279]KQW86656.1 alpha/beta hydrolase [Brevundimonas sp. Root1279]
MDDVERLHRPDGETLALKRVRGAGPTVLWIGGFRSDMEGTKALALDAAARERGWNYVRYDHFAHGQSSGDWRQATIGRWREDAVGLIDSLEGPVIPVGSSMGGWVALLATLARPDRVQGLVLVNPAQDFTERLMWPGLADHIRQAIVRDGEALIVEEGLGEYVLTRRMFEEARDWLLLDGAIEIAAPVHILQGRADDVVPWRHAAALVERLTGGDVRLDLIEGGDHRLSAPAELERLIDAVDRNR